MAAQPYNEGFWDSVPDDVVILVEHAAAGGGDPFWVDINDEDNLIAVRGSFQWRRPKPPGDPGQFSFLTKEAGGEHLFKNEAQVRVYHRPLSGAAYLRMFKGWIKSKSLATEGASVLVTKMTATGSGILLKEPPKQLMTTWRIGSAQWLANHPYLVGDFVQPYPPNGHKYECIQAGTSGNIQPPFSTTGGSTTIEPAEWQPSTAYEVGNVVRAPAPTGHRFQCLVAGTSHTSQPVWVTTAGGVTEETTGVEWQEIGSASGGPHWEEAGAAAVSDLEALESLLPEYYGDTVDISFINQLAHDVGYLEFPPGTPLIEALEEIAKRATTSNQFYFDYDDFEATHVYAENDFVEPTTPNGHWYRVSAVTGSATSGTEPTWPSASGATVVSGEVTFQEAGLLMRWEPNMPYVAGQFLEPFPANGRWYKALNSGHSGAAEPTWPTTTGDTVSTTGTGDPVTFVCMGATSVLPLYTMDYPNDNIDHDAPWTDIFTWIDANSDSMVPIEPIGLANFEDEGHYPIIDLTLDRESNETYSALLVVGSNNAVAWVPNEALINDEFGRVRSGVIKNDELTTNEACFAYGQQKLGLYAPRDAGVVKVHKLPDTSLEMLRALRKVRVTYPLYGLEDTVFPVSDLSGGLQRGGGIAEYDLTLGQGFLDVDEDIAARRQGGRPVDGDTTPPPPVTWEDDPEDPNYYLLDNVAHPDGLTASAQVQWMIERTGDIEFFYIQTVINGHPRWEPHVLWPDQSVDISNLPQGARVYVRAVAQDTRGNVRRNPDGSLAWSNSPIFTTPTYTPPEASTISIVAAGVTGKGRGWVRVKIEWTGVGDAPDWSGGGWVAYQPPHGEPRIKPIPRNQEYPFFLTIDNLAIGQPYLYKAFMQDRFLVPSPESNELSYTVLPPPAPPPPHDEWDEKHPDETVPNYRQIGPPFDPDAFSFIGVTTAVTFGGRASMVFVADES